MLIGFALLVASFTIANETIGIAALLFILPSITLNVVMRWINIGDVEYFITNVKDKVSIAAFFATLIGFLVLIASVIMANETMGTVALLFILPSITLNVAMRWINAGNENYFIKDNYNA